MWIFWPWSVHTISLLILLNYRRLDFDFKNIYKNLKRLKIFSFEVRNGKLAIQYQNLSSLFSSYNLMLYFKKKKLYIYTHTRMKTHEIWED